MKKIIISLFIVFSLLIINNIVSAAGDGSITIESPKKDEAVKGPDVTVKFKQVIEGNADHSHLFVDGNYVEPVKAEDIKKGELVVKGLKKGAHEIKLVAASKDHKMLKVEGSVKVKVD